MSPGFFRQLFDSTLGTYSYPMARRHGGEALIVDSVLSRPLPAAGEGLDLRLVKAEVAESGAPAQACDVKAVEAAVLQMEGERTDVAVRDPGGVGADLAGVDRRPPQCRVVGEQSV